MTTTIQPHELAIPVIDETKPNELFQGATLKLRIDQLEKDLDLIVLDPTSESDHKLFGSINRKIGILFASIDRAGKAIVDPLNKQIKVTNDQRKTAKERAVAIRRRFMSPRDAYDDEVLQHNQQIAKAFELMHMGHKTVGEYKAATVGDWDTLIATIEALELTAELFGDRLKEAQLLQGESLEMNRARRAKFVEDEAALEAGRAALKVQQDAEAAKRHAERVAAQEKSEGDTAPAKPQESAKPAAGLTVTKSAAAAKNAIFVDMARYGVPSRSAVNLINAIEAGQIKHLKIVE